MGALEEEVRELIKQQFGGVPRLAEETGVNKQTIYSALSKGLLHSSLATIMPLVEALKIDPLWLSRGRVVPQPSELFGFAQVPLVGTIAAGVPTEALANAEAYPIPTSLHERYPRAFLLRVSGESMSKALPNGCYALVDPCPSVDVSGDIYAVAIGHDNATIKRVRKLENGLELIPESNDPTFCSTIFNFNDPGCEQVHIVGKVVWYCVPHDWCYSPDYLD